MSVCVCDSIHKWSTDFHQCIPIHNSTELVKLLEEKYNTTGWIAQEARIIFMGAMIAGLIVVFFSVLCFLGVVLYCMHIRRRDRELKEIVHRLKEQHSAPTVRKAVHI
ncbi:uncharacterized protein LOC123298491 [Chrysoperla carnea]|uniref:uncharacterized protein LOC123298491 n=1 Tax=Chrysoperla carnea TaxID=189513 RepID=UPI001D06C5C3|nr:uncharacterized protein LOC123298491 [Chrysoperla carnea]